MGKYSTYRTEIMTKDVATITNATSTGNYTVDLPAGLYRLAVLVTTTTDFNATSCTIAFAPFLDEAQSKVGLVFNIADADDTTAAASKAFANGSSSDAYYILNGSWGNAVQGRDAQPIPIPNGLRMVYTKGGSPSAGNVTVQICAVRVG